MTIRPTVVSHNYTSNLLESLPCNTYSSSRLPKRSTIHRNTHTRGRGAISVVCVYRIKAIRETNKAEENQIQKREWPRNSRWTMLHVLVNGSPLHRMQTCLGKAGSIKASWPNMYTYMYTFYFLKCMGTAPPPSNKSWRLKYRISQKF